MAGIQRLGTHARLAEKHGRTTSDMLWSSFGAIALFIVPIVLALTVHRAFLFVSLGPIVYECIERPMAPASAPRNVIIANTVALLVGYAALAAFGLRHEPSSLVEGVTLARAGAVLVAVGITGALLALLHATHPPAFATLLLVVVGVVTEPTMLFVIFFGVIAVSAVSVLVNRSVGIHVPLWESHEAAAARSGGG